MKSEKALEVFDLLLGCSHFVLALNIIDTVFGLNLQDVTDLLTLIFLTVVVYCPDSLKT